MIKKLIDLAIVKWRSTFFIIFLLFIFGLTSYVNIPKESSPEIQIPYISIFITYEGVSPEDGEKMIVKPIEQIVKTISNIKKFQCESIIGSVSCFIEFRAGGDITKAFNDVKDKINRVKADFPPATEEPVVMEYDIAKDEPVLGINVMGEVSDDLLFKIGVDLKEQITSLKEVLEVNIYGNRDHSIEVIVPAETINQYSLNLSDFTQIQNQNRLLIGGKVRNGDGEFNFKIPGLIENIKDLLEMPVKLTGKKVILLKEIASIRKTYKESSSYARINGKKTISIWVAKRTGENIIFTVQKIRNIVEEYLKGLPSEIEVIYTSDTSKDIKENLSNLNNNIILAILIVFIVVLNMIGIREGMFIIATIPLTFLMGIAFLYSGGYTMNMVVLFGLILGTGMIVDASIVIIEYAEILLKNGISHTEAYSKAAKKMFIPIFSSVFTVIIVASPLLFWPDIIGQFMRYLPLTLIALLSSSFIAAIFLLPTIATKFGKTHILKENHNQLNYSMLESADIERLLSIKGWLGGYIKIVWKLLNNPKMTIFSLLLFLITITVIYINFNKGVQFFPEIEPGSAKIRVKARGNISLSEKDKIMHHVEKYIDTVKNDIRYYSSVTINSKADTIGVFTIEFKDWRLRRKAKIIMEDIRKAVKDIPGVVINVDVPRGGPSASKAIIINVLSNDFENIINGINKITAFMESDGSFKDIENKLPLNKMEYVLKINRLEALKYGIDILTIGNFIRLATDGLIISDYRPPYSEDKVDIILRFPPNQRSIENIKRLQIPSTNGGFVPISSFSKIITQNETTQITRINGKRVTEISANFQPWVTPSEKMSLLKKWINTNAPLLNVEFEFAGDDESQNSSMKFLALAFSTALVIMALLFLMQFNSLGKTIIVMSTIFFSIFGVLISLLLTRQPFGVVMSGLAVVSLSGMVVDSSILFIETFYDFRKISPLKEALIKSAIIRIKPILLITTTTIAGLIPMIFGISIDFFKADINIGAPSSEWWRQLSTGIAGGLAFSTILTLFFIPVIILIEENLKQKLKNGTFNFQNLKFIKKFRRNSINRK